MWIYVQAFFALVFVLALIGCLSWLYQFLSSSQTRPKNKTRRVGVIETTLLDTQRKLVLIQRDNVEHLVLIGGPNDLLIETQIKSRTETDPVPDPSSDLEPSGKQS